MASSRSIFWTEPARLRELLVRAGEEEASESTGGPARLAASAPASDVEAASPAGARGSLAGGRRGAAAAAPASGTVRPYRLPAGSLERQLESLIEQLEGRVAVEGVFAATSAGEFLVQRGIPPALGRLGSVLTASWRSGAAGIAEAEAESIQIVLPGERVLQLCSADVAADVLILGIVTRAPLPPLQRQAIRHALSAIARLSGN